jgi:hypothetical protein
MGRGLSEQQRITILAIGAGQIRYGRDSVWAGGWTKTPSQRASWSRTLARLQDRGLIAREYGYRTRDPCRVVCWTSLTEAGWSLYRQLQPTMAADLPAASDSKDPSP